MTEPESKSQPVQAASGCEPAACPPGGREGASRLTSPGDPERDAVFARLDALVNWERRSRRAAARFSLEPMRDLLTRLGSPQRSLDAARRVVHVAGSKGKGSVAALIARGAEAAGLRVGRYGSPHVEVLEERVEIAGHNVSTGDLAAALERVLAALDAARGARTAAADATWFDVVTAAALCLFQAAELDLWVLECGLGGRLDSTNAVDAGVAVITSIELEHVEVLGATRAAIAGEKAGILKPAAALVCGVPRRAADGRPDEAWSAIEQRASCVGASVVEVPDVATESEWEVLSLYARNQHLAAAALGELGRLGLLASDGTALGARHLTAEAIGLARLPGRLERLQWTRGRCLPVVVDGAHTPRSVRLALGSLEGDPELLGRPTVLLALGKDKDLPGILKALDGRADQLVCTSVGSELFRSPDQIAAMARELGWVAETAPSPRAGIEQAVARTPDGSWVLVLGSLYLAGSLRPLLDPPS